MSHRQADTSRAKSTSQIPSTRSSSTIPLQSSSSHINPTGQPEHPPARTISTSPSRSIQFAPTCHLSPLSVPLFPTSRPCAFPFTPTSIQFDGSSHSEPVHIVPTRQVSSSRTDQPCLPTPGPTTSDFPPPPRPNPSSADNPPHTDASLPDKSCPPAVRTHQHQFDIPRRFDPSRSDIVSPLRSFRTSRLYSPLPDVPHRPGPTPSDYPHPPIPSRHPNSAQSHSLPPRLPTAVPTPPPTTAPPEPHQPALD